jgi:hypothetical protein
MEMAERGIAIEGLKADTVYISDTRIAKPFFAEGLKDIMLSKSIDIQTRDGIDRGTIRGEWAKDVVKQ